MSNPKAPKPDVKGIQVESNDAVMDRSARPVESVVDDKNPTGIVIETFVGLQRGVNWADRK